MDKKVTCTLDKTKVQFKNNRLPKLYLFFNGYRIKSKNDYCTHYQKTFGVSRIGEILVKYTINIFWYKSRSEITLITDFNGLTFDWCDGETTYKYIENNYESMLKYIELIKEE